MLFKSKASEKLTSITFSEILQFFALIVAFSAMIFTWRSSNAAIKSSEAAIKSFEANIKQYRLSTKPVIQVNSNLDPELEPLNIEVKNIGSGPAEILGFQIVICDSFSVIRGNTNDLHFYNVKIAFTEKSSYKFRLRGLANGAYIGANEHIRIFEVIPKENYKISDLSDVMQDINKAVVIINYQSIYGDKYTEVMRLGWGWFKPPLPN